MLQLSRIAYRLSLPIKPLKTTAVSTDTGLTVTFPHLNSSTISLDSPIETFISSLAACETASLKAIAKKKRFKVEKVHWTRIESSYDLNHWKTGGGPENKMGDIHL